MLGPKYLASPLTDSQRDEGQMDVRLIPEKHDGMVKQFEIGSGGVPDTVTQAESH